MKRKLSLIFLLGPVVVCVVYIAAYYLYGGDITKAQTLPPVFCLGFLGFLGDALSSGANWLKNAAGKLAQTIPIIGPPIAAGLSAAAVLTQGGGVTVTDASGSTRYGSAAQPTRSAILNASIFGVPVLLIAGGGLLALILFRKRGRT